jgi:putative hydrolase
MFAGSSRQTLNDDVAVRLDEMAALLRSQGANQFRVRAYERGAAALRRLQEPVSDLLERGGLQALERLPDIGQSLARSIRDLVRFGYSPMLQRLRGDADPVRLLTSVPGIGPRLAARLHDDLNLETLEDLEAAAHDGRLERLAGFGPKRLAGIRAVLAERLGRVRRAPSGRRIPSVGELLDVDREYRAAAAGGRLPLIAPRRFNPGGRRWLPVLHTRRNGRHYTALFSNTALAHRLGRTDDWVVIYGDRGDSDGQWTVVTARGGARRGRRVVRGREAECERWRGTAPGSELVSNVGGTHDRPADSGERPGGARLGAER